jgi:UDP-galactopyranose mutase
MRYDIIIIGAGISGATLAERYANIGKTVLVIEKRNHIAGNCYDYIDENNIMVNRYGAHIFHTKYEDVWEYVNKFSKWIDFNHKVVASINDHLVPVPINIDTVNILLDTNIKNEEEMVEWLKYNTTINLNPINSKESCISRVGEKLYDIIFKHYTKKQWDVYPENLHPSILNRIPIRNNFDTRYFSDKYEAVPEKGYTCFVNNMLSHSNINVMIDTDYFKIKDELQYLKLFYTGPIDLFYSNFGLPKLEYRSLKFIHETYNLPLYQQSFVINYPSPSIPYTRSIEYKHLPTANISDKTTVIREYSTSEGEPYYPIISDSNLELYEKYRQMSLKESNIYFVGRLANYKYFNMDEAIKASLDLFYSLESK